MLNFYHFYFSVPTRQNTDTASIVFDSCIPSSQEPQAKRRNRASAEVDSQRVNDSQPKRRLCPSVDVDINIVEDPQPKRKVRPTAVDDDDDIQIIGESQPTKRVTRGTVKKEQSVHQSKVLAPDSLAIPSTSKNERQGTPIATKPNRTPARSREIIPDSIEELDETEDSYTKVWISLPYKSFLLLPFQRNSTKRTQKQAGLDDGLGETMKAVKQIKLSSSNDLNLVPSIRTSIPGKQFKKAPQGSVFFGGKTSQRISISQMNTWNGK